MMRNIDEPSRLEVLQTSPPVALLYCTCDDAVIECLDNLREQKYNNLSIFILDDSQTEQYRKIIDNFNFTVIRRSNRDGYKAGNINNWIKLWGNQFDYFVIVDADSILPPDFIYKMLLYGEHPSNAKIALFESRIHAWAPKNLIQDALAIQSVIASEGSIRLSNRLDVTLSNGHNNLCRTSSLRNIGGLDEQYIAEDHATTLSLIAHEYSCRIVNVESFEILPSNLDILRKRAGRWVRNDLQIIRHPWDNIPLTLQFRLVLRAIAHCLWLIIPVTMLVVLWANPSTVADVKTFIIYLSLYKGYQTPQMFPVLCLFAIYFTYLYLLPIFHLLSIKVGVPQSILSFLIILSIGFGNMFVAASSVIKSLSGTKFVFDVTPKAAQFEVVSLLNFSRINWLYLLFVLVVSVGALRNPAALVFNWPWIFPLIASPFILFISQKPKFL